VRRRRDRISNPVAGLLAIVLIATASTVGWFRLNPFQHTFKLQAEFTQVANLGQRSPVRIAGVEVGKVTKVEPRAGGGGRVTMQLKRSALPIHRDAQLKIRPRIFFEGNFFVDLQPGTPSTPDLADGAVVPAGQTSAPVQIGDVVGTLQSGTRRDLQTLLHETARTFGGGAAESLNRGAPEAAPALRNLALASDASLGEQPTEDVQRSLRGTARTTGAFAEDENALKGLVTDLGATAGALASEDRALSASVPALRDTLRASRPALAAVDGTLPPLRALSLEATPSVRRLHPVLDAALPFTRQLRALVGPSELRGTTSALRHNTPAVDRLVRTSVGLFAQGRAASRCTDKVLVPFAQSDFPDPDFPKNTGTVNQKLMRSFVGLSGESRSVDANQSYFHASAIPPALQVRPAPPNNPSVPPPHRPDVPCETQQAPNLEAPAANVAQTGGLTTRSTGSRRVGGPSIAARREDIEKAKAGVSTWIEGLLKKQARALKQERAGR
jgi:virulence factor Mce-like protein